MRHGSLFSGIGGFDLAAEWMGWTNVFHCEWMEFPRKVLDYHFPNADSHIDICKTDFKKYANKIDILTGGFPCQPFSLAGKRKGTDDERYLWGEMLRAIQEIKPRFVIAENVFGITNIDGGLVFEQVCLDLETEGYEVQPFIIPAAAKNAPHRRDRCWFIAQNPLFSGCVHGESHQEGATIREFGNTCSRGSDGIYLPKGNATDTISNGGQKHTGSVGCEIRKEEIGRNQFANGTMHDGEKGNATNSECVRLEYCTTPGQISGEEKNANGERYKSTLLTQANDYGYKSSWDNFPTQSPICSGDDGIPTQLDGITFSKWRAESIKGYGNAIVPQIAYQLFQIIKEL
jgi:DNA (cytosine-5)-methyltransferase 1